MNAPSVVNRGPAPPCPDPFNLTAHVLGKAQDDPDKVALAVLSQSSAERWSYSRLERTVLGLAGAFHAMGHPKGSRVLMRLGNTVEFPIVYLAAIAADLVPVPTSAQLTEPEITGMAATIAPSLVVASEGVALPQGCAAPVIMADELSGLAEAEPLAPIPGDPNRPGYIVFTSGTSGVPRAVVHAHRAIWARQMMVDGWYGLRPTDRVLHSGAFNWTYTLGTGLMDPWTIGATALIPSPGTESKMLPLLLKRHDATLFAAAPGVYRQMLRSPMPPLPKLRHGLSAGEKLPTSIQDAWTDATGTEVHEAFGMSECSTFLSGAPDHPAPPDTLGYPQPGRHVALLNDAGRPVPQGTPGVIAVATDDPGLMLGYFGAEEASQARLTEDGAWFVTGDMGRMGSDGAIAYLGRNDDMLNAGGFRVSPLEIEAALGVHPALDEVAAVEVSVKSDTTVIAAFYAAGEEVDPDELTAFAEARLAHYKTPRLYVCCEALPRSANGKLQRKALRQQYEAAHGAPGHPV
ncbi:MAG: class I adenylate-forming enzyme family protein [Pseudomonadota bacterium]